jgi:hypothetical protein
MIIYLILGIVYLIGILFTAFVDNTMLNKGVPYNGKHIITLFIIWLLSPIFMIGLIFISLVFFLKKGKDY